MSCFHFFPAHPAGFLRGFFSNLNSDYFLKAPMTLGIKRVWPKVWGEAFTVTAVKKKRNLVKASTITHLVLEWLNATFCVCAGDLALDWIWCSFSIGCFWFIEQMLCWHSKNTFSAHIMCALCTPPPHFSRALIQRSMHLYVSLHIPSLWLTVAIFMIWTSLTTRGKRLSRIIYEVPWVFRALG